MNEELRTRAIEDAAQALCNTDDGASWASADGWTRDYWRDRAALAVDAALAVVADWCDEQIAKIVDYGQSPDGFVCEEEAFERTARACRPVGEAG